MSYRRMGLRLNPIEEIEQGVPRQRDRVAVSLTDAWAFIAVVLLMGAYWSSALHPWETPRVLVLLAGLPIGAVFVGRAALAGDRSSQLATGVVVWAMVGALASRAPAVSVLGGIGRPSSVLMLACVAGLWGIGRQTTPRAVDLIGWGVAGVGVASGLAAIAQMALKPDSLFWSLELGRPVGLAGNPVYFGAHMAAAGAWFVFRYAFVRSWHELAAFSLSAFFASLSGSRVAIVGLLVIAVWAVTRSRTARPYLLVPAVLVGMVFAGLAHTASGTGQSSGERLDGSGVGDRIALWRYGLAAWSRRPLHGWGLGRFRGASQSHYSDAWAVRFADDRASAWNDAHNFIVEYIVAIGLIGLLLIAAFAWFGARKSSGPMVWMASAIAVGWLLEPAAVQTFGLAMLLLGAGWARPAPTTEVTRREVNRWVHAFAAFAGLALVMTYVASDQALDTAAASVESTADFPVWAFWLRVDPGAANAIASSRTLARDNVDPQTVDFVLSWSERAASREPDLPLWWANLSIRRLLADDPQGAVEAAQRALDLQPNHVHALEYLQIAALRMGDHPLFDRATSRLCEIGAAACGEIWEQLKISEPES